MNLGDPILFKLNDDPMSRARVSGALVEDLGSDPSSNIKASATRGPKRIASRRPYAPKRPNRVRLD
jgi:hypothetical protein